MKHLSPFKIFESKDNIPFEKLIPIATNEINWSWEYDSTHIKATIYFDPIRTENLYLHINRTHIKTGIGAGKFPRVVVDYEPVGTISKPELKKIQSILSEHKYSSDNSFNRQWTDMKGDELALGKIIKNSKYLKLSKLKNQLKKSHTKPKSKKIERQPNIEGVKIMKYGRGYVIYGEGTRQIKDDIKDLGARFNFRLTDPETGKKFSGWVISPRNLEQAKELTGVQVEEIVEESYSPEDIYYLKNDILNSFKEQDIIKMFPKMYDDFFDIIVEDSELDYMKSEDPDELEFDFANTIQVYISENPPTLETKFLEYYLEEKEFEGYIKLYNELNDNSKIIYDVLEQRLEIVFWTMLENSLL